MARVLILWSLSALVLCTLLGSAGLAQEEPSLPEGLGPPTPTTDEEPALPSGLTPGSRVEEEPTPPQGLGEEGAEPEIPQGEGPTSNLPFDLSGFWEARLGFRTQKDPHEKDVSIGETRLQLDARRSWEEGAVEMTGDFVYDSVLDRHTVRLEEGEGFFDLRRASLALTPAEFMDLKMGRQILTWGTGDLIFINDLFPKDWRSFFLGRDDEYLKAPSDALKGSLFADMANLDVVYTPRFDADRFIDGTRVSYFNAALGRLAGRDAIVEVDKPDDWFEDDEVAIRLYRNIQGYEIAIYGYHGFWKSPGGTDPVSGRATFPTLSVYGTSIRGGILRGIGHMEIGYYDSEDDRGGKDTFIRNSEFRILVGYEEEMAKDFTLGFQYYLKHMMAYDDYRRTLPAGVPRSDKNRHLFTVRLTKLVMNQNLRLSLFTFYSPSDSDAYLRLKIHYRIDDHWSAEIGGNIFVGKEDHTFFGQFKNNSNVYAGVRYSF